MRKREFVIGMVLLLASVLLTFAITGMSATYADLQPLAVVILILLVSGTVMVGHSIWHDLF